MSKLRLTLVFTALVLALALVWTWRAVRTDTAPAQGTNELHAAGDARAELAAPASNATPLDAPEHVPSERTSDAPVVAEGTRALAGAKGVAMRCTGRIVDVHGAGLAGAVVQVEQLASTRGGNQREVWRTTGFPNTTSAEDGSFALEFTAPAGAYALSARHAGVSSVQHRRFLPGESNIVIVLAPGGSLAGSIRLPEKLAARDVDVVLDHAEARDAGADRERHRRVDVAADGTFGADELLPGTWRAVVRLRGSRELARREPVAVKAGERTQLDTIDLAAELHTIRLEIANEAGALLPAATVRSARTRPGHDTWIAAASAPGVFDVLVPNDGVALEVACSGYATQELARANADQRVVLSAKIAVTLVARGSETLTSPESNLSLGVRVESVATARDDGAPAPPTRSFADGRELVFELDRAGSYRVDWLAFAPPVRVGLAARTIPLADFEPATIDVRAGVPEQRFELELPAGIWKRAEELAAESPR